MRAAPNTWVKDTQLVAKCPSIVQSNFYVPTGRAALLGPPTMHVKSPYVETDTDSKPPYSYPIKRQKTEAIVSYLVGRLGALLS